MPSPHEDSGGAPAERPTETTLSMGEIHVENKRLRASIKENHRGRFMRITEETGGKRSTVIIPVVGLPEFIRLLQQVVTDAEKG